MALRRELILDVRKYNAALDESYRRSQKTARRKQKLWAETGKKGEQSAKQIGDSYQQMGSRMEGLTGRMKLAIIGMFTAITLTASRMLRSTFGEIARFDQEMTKSLSIAGQTTMEQRRRMEDTAKQVSRTLNIELDKVAQAYFFLFSAGLDVEQSMANLPQVAAFAKAGMFDLATATDLATDAQSALGLVSKDNEQNLANLTRVTDVFSKANSLANATIQQFSESITNRAGAALRALNKDIEEGVAVLAVYADQGEKGQVSGERLNIVFRDLQRAARDNAEVFEDYNVQVFDSAGKMRNIADIVEDLENALEGASDKQKGMTLNLLGFQDRSVQALKALIGTSEAIREYEAGLRDAAGMTQEIADKQLAAFIERLGLLQRKLNQAFQARFVEPFFEKMGKAVDFAIDNFDDLTLAILSLTKAVTILVTGWVALKAPMAIVNGLLSTSRALTASYLVVVNGLRVGYYKLIAARTASIASLRAATTAQIAFNTALRASPIGIALTAVGALTGAIMLYRSRKKEATEAEKQFNEALQKSNMTVKESMKGLDELSITQQRSTVASAIKQIDEEIEQAQQDLDRRMKEWGQGAQLQFKAEIEQVQVLKDQRRELHETFTLLGKLAEVQKEINQLEKREAVARGWAAEETQRRLKAARDLERQMKIELGLVQAVNKDEEVRAANTAKIAQNYIKIVDLAEDINRLNQVIDESDWLENMVESNLIGQAEKELQAFNDEMTRLNNLMSTGNLDEEEFLKQSNERAEEFRQTLSDILLDLAAYGFESAELQRIIERAFSAASGAAQDFDEDLDDVDDSLKDINQTFGNLAEMTSSIITLADAFGFLDRRISQVARGAVDALRNLDRFQSLKAQDDVSNLSLAVPVIGAAAGITSIMAGLIQYGRDQSRQAEQQMKRMQDLALQLRANQRAIEKNTQQLQQQSVIGADVRKEDIQTVTQIIGTGTPTDMMRERIQALIDDYLSQKPIDRDPFELQRQIEEIYGEVIDNMNVLTELFPDFFDPWQQKFQTLMDQGIDPITAWERIVEEMGSSFEEFSRLVGDYGQSIEGATQRFRDSIEIGGLSIQEAWQQFIQDVQGLSHDIPDDMLQQLIGLDPERDGQRIQEIISQLFEGADQFRGDMTPNEFFDLLRFFVSQAGTIEEEIEQGAMSLQRAFQLYERQITLGGMSIEDAMKNLADNLSGMGHDLHQFWIDWLLDPDIARERKDSWLSHLFREGDQFRGDMSPEQWESFLESIVQFLDGTSDMIDQADSGTGRTSVSRSVQLATSITEFQGNEVVALLSSIDHFVRRIADDIRASTPMFAQTDVPEKMRMLSSMSASGQHVENITQQAGNVSKSLNYVDFRGARIGPGLTDSEIDSILNELRKRFQDETRTRLF